MYNLKLISDLFCFLTLHFKQITKDNYSRLNLVNTYTLRAPEFIPLDNCLSIYMIYKQTWFHCRTFFKLFVFSSLMVKISEVCGDFLQLSSKSLKKLNPPFKTLRVHTCFFFLNERLSLLFKCSIYFQTIR